MNSAKCLHIRQVFCFLFFRCLEKWLSGQKQLKSRFLVLLTYYFLFSLILKKTFFGLLAHIIPCVVKKLLQAKSFHISPTVSYSVVSIKRTGSLKYFEVFYHPELFFHILNEFFLPPWSFFHVLNEIFAPPCSLNRYYRARGQDEGRRGSKNDCNKNPTRKKRPYFFHFYDRHLFTQPSNKFPNRL